MEEPAFELPAPNPDRRVDGRTRFRGYDVAALDQRPHGLRGNAEVAGPLRDSQEFASAMIFDKSRHYRSWSLRRERQTPAAPNWYRFWYLPELI
jgi:hypothetical protein